MMTMIQKDAYFVQFTNLVKRISCSNFDCCLKYAHHGFEIVVHYKWSPAEPAITLGIPILEPYFDELLKPNQLVQMCYESFRTMLLHELDEQFKVDGKIVFNPHPQIKELEK